MIGDRYDEKLSRRSARDRGVGHFGYFRPSSWPTRDEIAEFSASAIVAACRSVLSTSSPVRAVGDGYWERPARRPPATVRRSPLRPLVQVRQVLEPGACRQERDVYSDEELPDVLAVHRQAEVAAAEAAVAVDRRAAIVTTLDGESQRLRAEVASLSMIVASEPYGRRYALALENAIKAVYERAGVALARDAVYQNLCYAAKSAARLVEACRSDPRLPRPKRTE